MDQQKYWITVVSKDHLQRGIAGGFMQANHGKQGPLKRIKEGDWVIFYSSKLTMNGDEKLQAFTAIGQASDNDIYQHKMSDDFIPYRRNIRFYDCKEVSIVPLILNLSPIKNHGDIRFGLASLR